MAILLDTQVVLWWLADDERLGPRAITALDAERDPVAVSSDMSPRWRSCAAPP